MPRILIIDDELSIQIALRFALDKEFDVSVAGNAPEAIRILQEKDIKIALLDQRLGDEDGMELLGYIRQTFPDVIVIAMTAFGSIEQSVEAMKKGAYSYLTKPFDLPGLSNLLNQAMDHQNMKRQIENLTLQLAEKNGLDGMIGKSKGIFKIHEMIDNVKDIDIGVLILGESGTGKELVVKSIHYRGSRASAPLETINCAAIPYHLLESELFGYEKGAFTGALQRYKGKLESADGGTMFFDEIGEMELGLQAKLLRVIEERSITPVGGGRPIPLNIRFVPATNKNLAEEVKKGTFREDLYYRLNVISIHIPPLRERKEDILLLAVHFVEKYRKQFNKNVTSISPDAVQILEGYDFPGNVRELENIIERAIALAKGDVIEPHDLPYELTAPFQMNLKLDWLPVYVGESLQKVEKKLTQATLNHFGGDKKQTAQTLGMSERHLRNKIKEYYKEDSEIISD